MEDDAREKKIIFNRLRVKIRITKTYAIELSQLSNVDIFLIYIVAAAPFKLKYIF